MATNATTPTEARSNQVPPELRRFLIDEGEEVSTIRRFADSEETFHRGWGIRAGSINFNELPDGYGVRIVRPTHDGDKIYAQIREE